MNNSEEIIGQLKQANAELEKFAYIASHDLKAPLRAITNLASWIKEDIENKNITNDTMSHLNLMINRVSRMDKLLDDLLTYSKVGKKNYPVEDVNIIELINGVIDMMPTDNFEISIETRIVSILTERQPLEQVIRNLLCNCIKHHHSNNGKINISIQNNLDHIEFTIADDGPGVPVENQKEIFDMFTTIKPRDELEGSGMGLALVKKIIENQDGEIKVLPGSLGFSIQFTWSKIK